VATLLRNKEWNKE